MFRVGFQVLFANMRALNLILLFYFYFILMKPDILKHRTLRKIPEHRNIE